MLDQLSLDYIDQPDVVLQLFALGFTLFGALLAGLFSRSRLELRRVPSVVYWSGLLAIRQAAGLLWLNFSAAMAGGYLWALVAFDAISGIALGYAFGIVAMARSRDAFGHGYYAILGFIPVANLVLLLKPPKKLISGDTIPTGPLTTGWRGVVSASILIVAGFACTAVLTLRSAEMENVAVQSTGIEYLIETQGLERTLVQLAGEVDLPLALDETLTLVELNANGTTLRYAYALDEQGDALIDSFRVSVTEELCANETLRPILDAGGTVELAYYGMDGHAFGTIGVTRKSCQL